MTPPFPAATIKEAVYWGSFLSADWIRDFPDRVFDGGLTNDGTPQRWSAEFTRWIAGSPDDGSRGRTTKVMRRLRRTAPRAYEVLYRAMVSGESIAEITTWLNERAIRNDIPLPANRPVHYREKDCVALFISGIEFARAWW